MTNKVYKTAMGKVVDLGSLMLQNEHVRAVGNMKVNARGDVLDSTNRVIDRKTNQVNRQYQRQTSGEAAPTNTVEARRQQQAVQEAQLKKQFPDLPEDDFDIDGFDKPKPPK